jgi:hypothetical protein
MGTFYLQLTENSLVADPGSCTMKWCHNAISP